MTLRSVYRLEGLEPDNLLAFMAMLGVLRSLEEVKPDWHPQVYWDVDKLPLRPVLCITSGAKETEVVEAIASGLRRCASRHDFGSLKDLKKLKPQSATRKLLNVTRQYERGLKLYEEAPRDKTRKFLDDKRYVTDLWASLISDVTRRSRKGEELEPTPLCLTAGQQHFLDRLASVPQKRQPPARGRYKKKVEISEIDCLREALFMRWERLDRTYSFRWDPQENVRYALCATEPSKDKGGTTQHGANRLAAVGLSALTVFPIQQRNGNLRLGVLGGCWDRKGFNFTWPIWRYQASLASIRAFLSHPNLNDLKTRRTLGIVECRRARRIYAVKYYGNFTRAIRLNSGDQPAD